LIVQFALDYLLNTVSVIYQDLTLFDDRNAISDTLSFFGRSDLLGILEDDLIRNQGIGLFGLRKSGKTSILLQLGFSLRHHPIVHIDLQPFGGKTLFGAELFNEIIKQLLKLYYGHETETNSKLAIAPFDTKLPAAELTTEFLNHIETISDSFQNAGFKLPILVFLDEVERILPSQSDPPDRVKEFNAFFGVLRSLSQDRSRIGLLVADVHPDCNRINQWSQEDIPTNPVFSFFKEVFLSPFTESENETMISDIGKLMGAEFDQNTLDSIFTESGGHPFIARQIASLLWSKHSKDSGQTISWEESKRFINKPFIYSSLLKDYFAQNIWADLTKRNFAAAIAILKILASNQSAQFGVENQSLVKILGKQFNESKLLDALLWLEMVGLVMRTEHDDTHYYQIKISMLDKWLRMEMEEEEISKWQIL
jgi:hypothetical protein